MVPTRRRSITLLTTLSLAAAIPAVAVAGPGHGRDGHGGGKGSGPSPTTPAPTTLPATIALPNGFGPEGIAAGPGAQLYAGSLAGGSIYRADARTGQGSVLVPAKEGRIAMGMKVAGKALVVAGGTTGHAYVYDTRNGAELADVTLTTGPGQINDVALGHDAAWFTDSRQQQLYKVTLNGKPGHGPGGKDGKGGKGGDHRGGKHDDRPGKGLSALRLGGGHDAKGRRGRGSSDDAAPALKATTLPITGDLVYDADPSTFEANGIAVLPGGKALLVVQSRTGKLFKVDARTGASEEVALTGGPLTNGDGLLLKGRTLYVVQNRINQIAVVKLGGDALTGTVERTITSPAFRVPTTVAKLGGSLYAVNARFGTPVTPDTDYDIVRVDAK